MKRDVTTHSYTETQDVLNALWDSVLSEPHIAQKPVVFMFYGNLGVGKTACVQALAQRLGIEDIVSPAFVIYYEYILKNMPFKALYHFDLYRITEENEFDYLGLRDILVSGNVVAIEWSEKSAPMTELLNNARIIRITIQHGGGDTRHMSIES